MNYWNLAYECHTIILLAFFHMSLAEPLKWLRRTRLRIAVLKVLQPRVVNGPTSSARKSPKIKFNQKHV